MAKNGKRAKKRMAKLRKKLGFLPRQIEGQRFGSWQARQDAAGKANTLGTTKAAKQRKLDRQAKQKGWDQ